MWPTGVAKGQALEPRPGALHPDESDQSDEPDKSDEPD